MNIDLLLPDAIKNEAYAPPVSRGGEFQTLTLQLALGNTRSGANPMAGTAGVGPWPVLRAGSERAAIVPVDASAITITF